MSKENIEDLESDDPQRILLENFKIPAVHQSIIAILRHALTSKYIPENYNFIHYPDNSFPPSQHAILQIFEPLSQEDLTKWILSIQSFPAPHIPKADLRAELLQSNGKLKVSEEELNEWILSHPVPQGYKPPDFIPLEELLKQYDKLAIELHKHMPTLELGNTVTPVTETPPEETAYQEATRLTEQLSQMALINISSEELHSHLQPETYIFDVENVVPPMIQETLRKAINIYQQGLSPLIDNDYIDALIQLRNNKKDAFIDYLTTHDTVRDYISKNMPQLALSDTNFKDFRERAKDFKVDSSLPSVKQAISFHHGLNLEIFQESADQFSFSPPNEEDTPPFFIEESYNTEKQPDAHTHLTKQLLRATLIENSTVRNR